MYLEIRSVYKEMGWVGANSGCFVSRKFVFDSPHREFVS